MSVRALSLLMMTLVLAGGAAPAAAAPTLSAERPCYATDHDDVLTFHGTGFTPGEEVAVMLRGSHTGLSAWSVADAAGTIKAGGGVPPLPVLGFPATVHRALVTATAADLNRLDTPPTDPLNAFATTTLTITDWALTVSSWEGTRGIPAGHPRAMATFAATGWTWVHGTPLYAHYLRDGRLVRTVRLMIPAGPCGDATAQMPEFPFRPVPAGTYRVLFSPHRSYPYPGWYAYYPKVRVAEKDAVR